MIKKTDKYLYQIETAGLCNEGMYFSPGWSCGKIKYGISMRLSCVRGGWNISLLDAWRMVLISTVVVIQYRIRALVAKVFAKP